MSLARLVYYGAVIGGWAAFVGWLISALTLDPEGRLNTVLICGLVGAAICAGLNMVAGMANGQWKQQLKRVVPALLGGFIGGAVGSFLGDFLVHHHVPRAFGWAIMGAAIGMVEGLYDRSPAKLRNGLIGGSIGGLLGGFLFDPITQLIASNPSGMTSRATAFVILGACIGILIGFVQVVLKEAWLTVLDGYRPGRQLILTEGVTVLGKAEYAALPFVGKSDNDLDREHARIVRQAGGKFAVEDNNSKMGVMLNGARVQGRALLNDGDVLKIGSNMIRFSERRGTRKAAAGAPAPTAAPARTVPPPTPAQPQAPKPAPAVPARPSATSQFDPPAPRPAAKPLTPTATIDPPAPKPAPSVSPAAAPPGATTCPKCGRAVSKGQRYCIACDLHF